MAVHPRVSTCRAWRSVWTPCPANPDVTPRTIRAFRSQRTPEERPGHHCNSHGHHLHNIHFVTRTPKPGLANLKFSHSASGHNSTRLRCCDRCAGRVRRGSGEETQVLKETYGGHLNGGDKRVVIELELPAWVYPHFVARGHPFVLFTGSSTTLPPTYMWRLEVPTGDLRPHHWRTHWYTLSVLRRLQVVGSTDAKVPFLTRRVRCLTKRVEVFSAPLTL